jgi:ABC-type transport system involved in cytochrome bd biosynthesis fused ATPase/permease subunit
MITSLQTTATPSGPVIRPSKWPLERVLFAMAGTVTLVSALLAASISPWFLLLTAIVGVNQWLYVMTRACPVSIILKRFGVAPQCRW